MMQAKKMGGADRDAVPREKKHAVSRVRVPSPHFFAIEFCLCLNQKNLEAAVAANFASSKLLFHGSGFSMEQFFKFLNI